jgi:hypothetical protein
MKTINPDVIPQLQFKDIIADECVAIEMIEAGILILYMERDAARLLEWKDLVTLGLKDVLKAKHDELDASIAKEIEAPAKPL